MGKVASIFFIVILILILVLPLKFIYGQPETVNITQSKYIEQQCHLNNISLINVNNMDFDTGTFSSKTNKLELNPNVTYFLQNAKNTNSVIYYTNYSKITNTKDFMFVTNDTIVRYNEYYYPINDTIGYDVIDVKDDTIQFKTTDFVYFLYAIMIVAAFVLALLAIIVWID